MCGICGVYEFGRTQGSVNEKLIVQMRDLMVHRGPDSHGSYISKDSRLGLGFRRLAIVDLSPSGNQPMTNEDSTLWLVFNGEIYNHKKLRSELISKGHVYRSETDSETLLHLYEEHSYKFVDQLQGMFAIALWNSTKQELLLIRDRLGVKPLYYSIADGKLIFASEIKSILAHPSISRDVDEVSLYHYLTFFTTPAPSTMFKGIKKLSPGEMLICSPTGIRVETYWNPIVETPKQIFSEEEYAVRLLELLDDAVKKRMMSDVPFGVFLSGGVDSSANVALMAAHSSEPVRTFTVGFKGLEDYNELHHARRISQEFGTNHHEVLIGPGEVHSFLPELIYHQDEPIADPVCVPLYYVSKLARESGTIVVQVGEGADEIFCGYTNYVDFLKIYENGWKTLERLPRFLKYGLSKIISPFDQMIANRLPRGKKIFSDLIRRLGMEEELFWGGTVVFDEVSKKKLMPNRNTNDSLAQLNSHDIIKNYLTEFDNKKPNAEFLERMTYLDLRLRLAELLLMRVDKITMATSVEARVPFLDHLLVEFAMTIPRSLKYKNGETKYILKKALEGILPHDVLYRKKQGFGMPVREWFMSGFGKEFDEKILNSRLRNRNFFDYKEIEHLLSEHRSGRIDYGFHLWGLLNLSLWYERWIDN